MRHFYLHKIVCTTCIIGFLLICSSHALAQTCTVSMGSMAVSNVNTLTGAAVDTTVTMTITCSGGQAQGQRLCISLGAGSASDATTRKMTSRANSARYDLYSTSSRPTLWGG